METRGLRARASAEAGKRTEAEKDDQSGEGGGKAGGRAEWSRLVAQLSYLFTWLEENGFSS